MAILEGARAAAAGVALATNQGEFIVVGILPDVCWTSGVPVPYPITAKLDYNSIHVSKNVNFCGLPAFTENSRVLQVTGNEPGLEGGVVSTTNLGFCRPVRGLNSSTVRVNGAVVDYNIGTLMHMNCLGPEGPGNTLGILLFTGPMIPGPVTASGKIPGSFLSAGGLLDQLKGYYKTAKGIYDGAKKLYDIVNIDWSDPSAVLGAIGGVAGFAGLEGIQNAAKLAQQANAVAQVDFDNPRSVFGALGQLGAMAGYQDVVTAAAVAQQAHDIVNTDWDNPQAVQAALSSMGRIARLSGLDLMAAELAHETATGESIELDSRPDVSKLQNGFMPRISDGIGKVADYLGGSTDLPTGVNAIMPEASISNDGRLSNLYDMAIEPQTPAEAAFLASNRSPQSKAPDRTVGSNISDAQLQNMQQQNPIAFERYSLLSDDEKQNVIIENSGENMVMFLPGEGFSSSRQEIDNGPLLFDVPENIREVFVSDGTENFFGIKEKKGNWYLFGGAIDLGSPEMPGAGTASTWFVPDRILSADMSDFFAFHDENYYGDNVRLSDLGEILSLEGRAFAAGAKLDPLQLPLQVLYSAATTTVGVGTATYNSLKDFYDATFENVSNTLSAAGEDIAGIMDGSGLSDIGNNILNQFGLGENPAQTPGGGSGAGGGAGADAGSGSASGSKPVKQGSSVSVPIDGILITRGGYGTAGLSAGELLGGVGAAAGSADSGPDSDAETGSGKPGDGGTEDKAETEDRAETEDKAATAQQVQEGEDADPDQTEDAGEQDTNEELPGEQNPEEQREDIKVEEDEGKPEEDEGKPEDVEENSSLGISGGMSSEDGASVEAKATKELYNKNTDGTEVSISAQGEVKISGSGYEATAGVKGEGSQNLGSGFQLDAEVEANVGVKNGDAIATASGQGGLTSPKGDGVYGTSEVGTEGAKFGIRIQGATESSLDGIPNDGDNIGGEVGVTTKKVPYIDVKFGEQVVQPDGTTKTEYGVEIGGLGRYLEFGYEDFESKKGK